MVRIGKIQDKDTLNKGSVAIVSQMCTLSKLRIYHPKHKGDELYTFRLVPDKLDEIDKVISELFLKPSTKKD